MLHTYDAHMDGQAVLRLLYMLTALVNAPGHSLNHGHPLPAELLAAPCSLV